MLAGPAGCLRSRWRSSPRKWRNDAVPRGRVRKHPAPEGALRLVPDCREHSVQGVRKHPAPQGALRPKKLLADWILTLVRKHPAPEGTLRRTTVATFCLNSVGQKAPSTRRCIKTNSSTHTAAVCVASQEAPSTRRCIKTRRGSSRQSPAVSESTQHHKVHQDMIQRMALTTANADQKAPNIGRCTKTFPVGRLARSSRGTQSPDGPTEEAGRVDSHSRERRPFGLTSLEVGGWSSPTGCRWRLASGRRKVVKSGHCRPVPRGACGAGGAPASGSGATTPLPEAGVRKHPARQGALRQDWH